jgi:ADP-dependent NAD(P)H-hydrate dehydratase / NAD(P)H-hydrate epimerase
MLVTMIPVVTPTEMADIDRSAPEPTEVLIGRAGAAVARAARRLLGGTYGRRVIVVAGPGNNGNDGRHAATRLRAADVRVVELDAADVGPATHLRRADLVIDAAYGTGFRGAFHFPEVPDDTPVLAVDIPSGIDGLTGAVGGPGSAGATRVQPATATVTFAALKPGLLLGAGPALAGAVEVVDIGLDVSSARTHLVSPDDARAWLPTRAPDTHKWRAAVWIVAGSPGMTGAAALAAAGAQRAGAGYVRLSTPGGQGAAVAAVPVEVVQVDLPPEGWDTAVVEGGLERFGALVVGNGLGRDPATLDALERLLHAAADAAIATVVDADGLAGLGPSERPRLPASTVLTPHDGEFARLTGDAPGPDRIASTRSAAATSGAVILLKGPTTIIAHPDGRVLLSATGDDRLATAGTGDVLAGVIGALAAQGLEPLRAAAAGATLHGAAAALGWRRGLVAGDLPPLLPAVLCGPGRSS